MGRGGAEPVGLKEAIDQYCRRGCIESRKGVPGRLEAVVLGQQKCGAPVGWGWQGPMSLASSNPEKEAKAFPG